MHVISSSTNRSKQHLRDDLITPPSLHFIPYENIPLLQRTTPRHALLCTTQCVPLDRATVAESSHHHATQSNNTSRAQQICNTIQRGGVLTSGWTPHCNAHKRSTQAPTEHAPTEQTTPPVMGHLVAFYTCLSPAHKHERFDYAHHWHTTTPPRLF